MARLPGTVGAHLARLERRALRSASVMRAHITDTRLRAARAGLL
jgi:hypothetical protein